MKFRSRAFHSDELELTLADIAQLLATGKLNETSSPIITLEPNALEQSAHFSTVKLNATVEPGEVIQPAVVGYSVTCDDNHCGNLHFQLEGALQSKLRLDTHHPNNKREIVELHAGKVVG